MSGLELAFLAMIIIGAGFVFFTLVVGEIADVLGGDGGDAGDGPGWASPTVLAGAVTAYGLAGFVATRSGLDTVWAVILGAVFAVAVGFVMITLLRALTKQQSNSQVSRASYEGLAAVVTLSIPPGGKGQVQFRIAMASRYQIGRVNLDGRNALRHRGNRQAGTGGSRCGFAYITIVGRIRSGGFTAQSIRYSIVILLLIFAALQIYIRNYIKVPLNQVAVFTWSRYARVIRGGARFQIPGLERVAFMSLEPFNVNIELKRALAKGGVPINVEAVGLVRIGSEDEAIMTGIRFYRTTIMTNRSSADDYAAHPRWMLKNCDADGGFCHGRGRW